MIGIMQPDETDRTLLALLEGNARMSTVALARRVGLSRTTVQSRIARMERAGVIAGYTTVTPAHDADAVRAHVMITITPRHAASVEAALRPIREIRELHAVSGMVDMIAVGGAGATETINRVIDRIGMLGGVERTTSAIILSTRFRRRGGEPEPGSSGGR